MIGFLARRGCRTHRAALTEFAAHRTGGPDVRRALDHVDRCRACEGDLVATTLVLHALRRLHAETGLVEPAPDGWSQLRERLAATRREPSRVLSGLPGIVVAAALCAALGGPGALDGGSPLRTLDEAPWSAVPAVRIYEPPAGRLSAGLVIVLAGDQRLDRPRVARALTLLPVASDRSDREQAPRRAGPAVALELSYTATRE